MLKPLHEYVCDHCKTLINEPSEGWVHWRRNKEHKTYEIQIVHHINSSPAGSMPGCYPPSMEFDYPLSSMLGPHGVVHMLAMIDVGKIHQQESDGSSGVADHRNWRDVFMRLTVPHYEEARIYFDRARSQIVSDGSNEIITYSRDDLVAIIEEYSDDS